ncbi:MAG: squalene--hopene cyclase [Planctomycetota bacterium]
MHATGIAVAVLAAAAAVGVTALVRTRWLQSRTLEKCIGLSVVLHLVVAVVAAFTGGWSPASWGRLDEGRMTMMVVLADEASDDEGLADAAPASEDPAVPVDDAAPAAPPADPVAEAPKLVSLAAADAAPAPPDLVPLLDAPADEPTEETLADAAADAEAPPGGDAQRIAAPAAVAPTSRVPEAYADRIGSRRAAAAAARGGSAETERAVQAGLAWLAAAQSTDGRWDAARHGAGRGRAGSGQHSPEVGGRADHGVTGLALLAFLGAGNTHLEGPHAATVARGIGFLAGRQRADGSLAGDAEFFAALYCHGMATIAVGECAALSCDQSLRPVLERAIRHTLATQHPATGGWRYAAGDRGDTSQLGWQVMALAAARNAGLTDLEPAQGRALAFLGSVSSGSAGGLAAYRQGERPSVAMTAETLFCRLLLGMPADHPAAVEALGLIAGSPPVAGTYNIYTWYYATLASFHAGGPQWEAWNGRLQAALLPLQHRSGGLLDGSWDPDPVWGGHGGRVYSTALAALTLEVYYRYLPLHGRTTRMAATP